MKIRRIDRRHQESRRRVEWILDYYTGGRRVRRWFRSKVEAEAEAAALAEQKRSCGEAWTELSPAERSDLMLLYVEAQRENVTLRQVWEAFRSGKLDATPMQRRTLREAIRECIAAKRKENLRERYVNELENYLEKFAAGRTEAFVDRITVADIETWFDNRDEALTTRRSNLGRLSSLFDVCWRRGYAKENPCLRITPPKVDQTPPRILTSDEAKRLLQTCRDETPRLLPWLTLGMFCGIRPEELEKLTWRDVDLTHAIITIDAAASKTRRRRTVPLRHLVKRIDPKTRKEHVDQIDVALRWLQTVTPGKSEDSITPSESTMKRDRAELRDAAKIGWTHDLLRHTAGSYLLALHQDAGKVANMLGNSARILEQHYKNLVTATACAEFWRLTPQACK